MPKVSIITPFYNGSQYIQKCIDGIQTQSFKDFEHIIVDDGSTESENKFLSDIVAKYPNIILISQKNSGQASAVNAGIKIASGEYVAFCDQDDWWFPEKLKIQISYLESHPDIAMVYTDAHLGDENGNVSTMTWMRSRNVKPHEGKYNRCIPELFRRNFVCAPLVILMKKKVFDDIGLMNEACTSAYDYDFLFRYFEAGYSVGFMDKPLAAWRMHEGQESGNIRKAKRFQASILYHFLLHHPDFVIKHPFIVVKKALFTVAGLLFNRSRTMR